MIYLKKNIEYCTLFLCFFGYLKHALHFAEKFSFFQTQKRATFEGLGQNHKYSYTLFYLGQKFMFS